MVRFAQELATCIKMGIKPLIRSYLTTVAKCNAPAWERPLLYSTVTLFARLRGWSTSVPFSTATW